MLRRLIVVAAVCFLAASVAAVSAENFDLTRATRGVMYSKLAYCDHDHIKTWVCTVCAQFPNMTDVAVAQVDDQACTSWLGYDRNLHEIVWAFRGTINLQGWIVDGIFFQEAYDQWEPNSGCGPNCMIMSGLYSAYYKLRQKLWPQLLRLSAKYPTAKIQVSGHSMGAAQSGFAFADVVRKLPAHKGPRYLYNYGQPRLGNEHFSRWYYNNVHVASGNNSFRATNLGDPIVHLPPLIFDNITGLGKWIHSPREVFWADAFGPATNYKICNGTYRAEDPTCADSTPWYDFGMQYHTTYLDIGMGCF